MLLILFCGFLQSVGASLTYRSPTPAVPLWNGSSQLPSPSPTLSLKHVTIGRGVQNYTCAESGSIPVPVGALASLFDVTGLAYRSQALVDAIPSYAVYLPTPDLTTRGFPRIGHHYFDSTGTPVFNLSLFQQVFFGNKTAGIKAPSDASRGPENTGAVDWIQLKDKGGSIGCLEVYRVFTAGGSAPSSCKTPGVVTEDYSSEYWFYG